MSIFKLMSSSLLLRVGIAFAFLYPSIDSVYNPDAWIGFFPRFMLGYLPDSVMLTAWGAIEAVIALWILSGRRIFIPSILATILLVSIVVFNFSLIDILFRDLALAFAAASLARSSYGEE